MKKYISIFLVFVLAMSLCPSAYAATATYDYLVEAENYKSWNFQSTGNVIDSDTTLSGEKYVGLYTKNNGKYYTEYSVNVTKTGVYDLFVASSPLEGSSWSSKIYLSVNNGEETELTGQAISTTGNSKMKWYSAGGVTLKAGANTIKFAVYDMADSGYYAAFLDCFGLNLSSFSLSHIDSDATMKVFEGGDKVSLSVYGNAEAIEDSTYTYRLKNIYGNIISSGDVVIKAGAKKANIDFENIDFGYYALEVGTLKTAFSVVKPMSERKSYSDTPFAIDTGFSDSSALGVNDTDYAKILGLSGVSWIRDRIRFSENVTYANGQYTFGKYLESGAELLHPYGIKISNAAEYMPENLRNDYGTYISTNLIEVYKFWKSVAENYGSSVDNWEILNEVDKGGAVSGWDAPDLYAASMKAATVGIYDGSGSMASVQGAAMNINDKSEYGKILMRNGVSQYSAFDNTHHHQNATSTPFADYYEFSGMTGVADREEAQKELDKREPIWVTEAGIPLKASSGVELTEEQQLVQAKYIVTSAVESIASGTDKHFFFIGPRYHEGEYSWGMMSEVTYKPYMYASYSAQCAMTDILGQGTYKGVIDKGNSNVSAYLFNNSGNEVIVVWSKAGTQTVSFNANGKVYDMWGNEKTAISTGNSLTIGSEPVYIVCESHSESAVNSRDPQMTAQKKELNDAQRVILMQKYSDVSRGGSRTDGYMISADNNTVTLEVANLSEKTMTGKISYKTENGWKLDKNNVDISVEPMSVETVTFTITPQYGVASDYLTFIGTFNGETTSPSTVKLVETKDGTITLEAETDAKSQNGFSAYTQSSNQGLKIITTTTGEYKIEFEVVSANGGVYDLWTLGGILDYAGCSNHVIKVNGREISPSSKNTKDVLYSSGDNAVGWNSYNDVRLLRGKNTVEFGVSTTRNSGDNYIVSALDKLVFVPKGLVGYREAENFTSKTGLYATSEESVASGGATMELYTYYIEDPISNNTLSYDFAVNENAKYDVWVLSSEANVEWLTKWKVGFDGSTPSYPSSLLQKVEDVVDLGSHSLFWYRIQNDVSLNRGIHTVSFEGSEKRTSENDYMLHVIDAVVVVKETSSSSWSNAWKPVNTAGNIQNNKINILKKVLLTEYDLTNITDSITLPKNIEGAAISWSSSNPSVVSQDGVVNRPDKGTGDASVTLTATINVDGTTSTQTYTLKVKEYTEADRTPELIANFEESENGYSGIQMYVKNTDVLADENGNMPAVVVAKYSKSTGEFLGFVGDQHYTYTNAAGDRIVVNDNRVYCYINEAEAGSNVSFAVYKEGTKPGSETIAYVNEYRGKAGNDEIKFSFTTDMGEDAYRVVINKNGETYSKIIHIFEGQVIIYDENDTQDDIFVKQGIGQRIISTKGEIEMPLWQFLTPEDEEDITYKVFLWEWYSLTPLVEAVILNN